MEFIKFPRSDKAREKKPGGNPEFKKETLHDLHNEWALLKLSLRDDKAVNDFCYLLKIFIQ